MKRAFSFLLTFALLFTLAGCGKAGRTAGNGPDSSGEQNRPSETKNSPSSEAPAGKWVTGKTVEYRGDGSVSSRWEYEYDASGNATRALMYDSDGALLLRDEYEYDAAGRVTKYERYMSSDLLGGEAGSFQKTTSQAHAYDAAGHEIRYVLDDALQWEAEYDQAGTRIKYLTYKDGEVDFREECETDAAGRTVKVRDCWTGGEESCWIPEYDEAGRERKTVQYSPDGSAKRVLDFEYDAAGNMTKRVDRHPEGYYEIREEWEYDEAGNQIKYWEDGVLKWEKAYDAAGNLTKELEYCADGTTDRNRVYEYDAAGNQISCVDYDKDGGVNYRIVHEYAWFPLP